MNSTRYAKIRERTGMSAYAFGGELERRGVMNRDYYLKIDRGTHTPGQKLEDGVITVNAELRGVTFNEVLLELRGEPSNEPQLQAAV